MKTALFIALGIFGATYLVIFVMAIRERPKNKPVVPDLRDGFVGLITNFFDTLGIGSYATTTSFFKLWGLVRDEQIPGTMNVGHTIPTLIQAFIYIAVVQVDVTTLTLMVAASAVGAWLGAGVVAKWSRRKVQIGMGIALLAMASAMLMTQLNLLPGGGDQIGLTGVKLAVAVAANAMLGALMTLGIGLYAPCMIIIFLMGMSPESRVSDHDGVVRVSDAGGQRPIHSGGEFRSEGVAGSGDRRDSGRADRGVHRERNSALFDALAGGSGRGVHGVDDVAVGDGGEEAGGAGCRRGLEISRR